MEMSHPRPALGARAAQGAFENPPIWPGAAAPPLAGRKPRSPSLEVSGGWQGCIPSTDTVPRLLWALRSLSHHSTAPPAGGAARVAGRGTG